MSIPVFLASDDNYAPFVATTIYSILSNTRSEVDFYVLDGGITSDSKALISTSLKDFGHYTIEYIDMSSYNLAQFPNLRHYSVNTFSRYFIPALKPELSKVLYLDVDIIVVGDIADLYHHDLGQYPLGAVLEDFYVGNYSCLKEKIYPDYQGGSNYFNAGILLLNLDYFREHDLTKKLIQLTSDLADTLSCPDQDVFNIIFENNFKVLDYKFNFMPDHFHLLQALHPHRAYSIKDNVTIYHYTAGKPWKNLSCASDVFWKYANKTAFKKPLIKKYLTLSTKDTVKKSTYYILAKLSFGKSRTRYTNKYQKLLQGTHIYN